MALSFDENGVMVTMMMADDWIEANPTINLRKLNATRMQRKLDSCDLPNRRRPKLTSREKAND